MYRNKKGEPSQKDSPIFFSPMNTLVSIPSRELFKISSSGFTAFFSVISTMVEPPKAKFPFSSPRFTDAFLGRFSILPTKEHLPPSSAPYGNSLFQKRIFSAVFLVDRIGIVGHGVDCMQNPRDSDASGTLLHCPDKYICDNPETQRRSTHT